MQPRDRFFRWLGASAVVMAAMAYVDNQIKTVHAPYGIVSFEFAARTPELSMATLRAWTPHQKQLAAFSLGLDYLFMPCYASMLASACWWAGRRFAPALGNALAYGQFAAAIFDARHGIVLFTAMTYDSLIPTNCFAIS